MSGLALKEKNARAAAAPAVNTVLVQRRPHVDGPGTIAAPAIRDGGTPLDLVTRSRFESGFGRPFEAIRVHDDARAHDDARSLGARAYAAGNDIVFGEGQYRPQSRSGLALIGHELAHSVQQGGVQMNSAEPIPASVDRELERQADRAAEAALAYGPLPALSTVNRPAIFKADLDDPAPGGAMVPPKMVPNTGAKDLPDWVTASAQDDPADSAPLQLTVETDVFQMPVEKGGGEWVEPLYASKSNFVSVVFPKEHYKVFKEGSATDEYRQKWLQKYGFNTTAEVVTALKAAGKDPEVKQILDKQIGKKFLNDFTTGLSKSKSAVDHIIEKHLGGASTPENLQLFDTTRNSASGSQSASEVARLARQVAAPGMRGAKAQQISIIFKKVKTKPPGDKDPTYWVEKLLRDGTAKGNDAVKQKFLGKPVKLVAGVNAAVSDVSESGTSPIDDAASRVVRGARLEQYTRVKAQGKKASPDKVTGTLDNRAIRQLNVKDKGAALVLTATKVDEAADKEAGPLPKDVGIVAPAETRHLAIEKGTKGIAFYYPYLSPGQLNTVELKEDGVHGEGVIHPSVGFLGDIKVKYGPETLVMDGEINVASMNQSRAMKPLAGFFRFTKGNITIDLMKFKPEGKMDFTIGPATKPYVEGFVKATADGTTFIAEGEVKTAATLPGLKEGTGKISYRSDTGWSGSLTAKSSTIKGANADVTMTFREARDHFAITADGKIWTQVRGAELVLGARWADGDLVFYGGVTVKKPLPMVDSASLSGEYTHGLLKLNAKSQAHWKVGPVDVSGEADIHYHRKGEEGEGKFFGSVTFGVHTEKMDGDINVTISEEGKPSGHGEVSYQLTKQFRPKLGIDLEPTGKVKLSGEAKVPDIPLTDQWPKAPDDRKSIIKGSVAAHIPTPVPALEVTLKVTGELGVSYSVGPMALTGLSLAASLYPFEDDKKITAKLTGAFVIPAKGGLYGRFGVLIGAEVAYGALGAEGGLYVVPDVTVNGEAGIKINADYADDGFSFEGDAYARGAMFGSLGIDFAVDVSALWGLVDHEWTIPIKKWGPKKIGPELNITLGKVGYSKEGKITWPSLSQIDVSPKEFDPIGILQDVLKESVGS